MTNRSGRPLVVMTAAVLAAVLAGGLSGCATLRAAAAAPGSRPGVDVPSRGPDDRSPQPLGRPELAPPGTGGYAFLAVHQDGSPVTWDPCRPIHVVVRPDHEPPGARSLLLSVLGELSAASGLRFVDDGSTSESPSETRAAYQPDRYGDRWAPVLVTWSSPAETPMLTDDVLGRAGPDAYGLDEDRRFVSGSAVFNASLLTTQITTGDDAKARAVLLHELGHLVGLGHVPDAFQVMYDTNSYPLARYHAGDLRGLELLGQGRCFDSP